MYRRGLSNLHHDNMTQLEKNKKNFVRKLLIAHCYTTFSALGYAILAAFMRGQ